MSRDTMLALAILLGQGNPRFKMAVWYDVSRMQGPFRSSRPMFQHPS